MIPKFFVDVNAKITTDRWHFDIFQRSMVDNIEIRRLIHTCYPTDFECFDDAQDAAVKWINENK